MFHLSAGSTIIITVRFCIFENTNAYKNSTKYYVIYQQLKLYGIFIKSILTVIYNILQELV